MRASILSVFLLLISTGATLAQENGTLPDTQSPQAEVPEIQPEDTPRSGFRDLSGSTGRLVSTIVTIDREALFLNSEFGQRVQRELEQDTEALTAENRKIEGELITEERDLTVRRNSMTAEEFAPLAEEFDAKVQRIRNEQDRKSILLQQRLDQERQTFLGAVSPILGEIAQSRGAVAVLDRNLVLLAFEGIDITEEAIARIDAQLGDNAPGQLAPAAPLPRPQENLPQPTDQ